MLEVWATLRVWSEYIIPAIAVILIILAYLCVYTVKAFQLNRKIRWLRNHGFQREISGVPSFGDGAFYAWRNKRTGKSIDERDLDCLKFDALVNKLK